MAMVHPSRMGLVPQDSSSRRRSPSPPSSRRSISPRRKPDARSSHRDNFDDRDRNRARDRYPSRQEDDYDDDRSRGRNRDRERAMDRGERRRASPKYEDYGRPSSPRNDSAPRQQGENMYPIRDRPDFQGRDPSPHNGYASSRSGGGADFFESRRLQRETMTVNIWPPSPKAPTRDLSPKRSSKKSKRQPSISSDTDSEEEEERRRRERKERKKRKEQRKEEKREKKRKRSRSRRRSDDEEEYRRSRRKSFSKSKSPQRAASRSRRTHSPSLHNDDDEWVVKDTGSGAMLPPPVPIPEQAHPTNPNHDVGSDEDDDLVGPQPAPRANAKRVDERSYGGALLRGEGSAMAAFLQDGTEARIPRRGEIGLTSDEIAKYEDVGYVMSGSRHRRMNAVRIRKENQVISAEEKRGILKLQKEERERREAILREEFSELVQESLKGAEKPKAG